MNGSYYDSKLDSSCKIYANFSLEKTAYANIFNLFVELNDT